MKCHSGLWGNAMVSVSEDSRMRGRCTELTPLLQLAWPIVGGLFLGAAAVRRERLSKLMQPGQMQA